MKRLSGNGRRLIAVVFLTSGAAFSQTEPPLTALYDGHHWFQLRDALRSSTEESTFYRGAVAAAFNDSVQAERLLRSAISASPKSADANEARNTLTYVYFRGGQYRHALKMLHEVLAAQADETGAKGFGELLAVLATEPELSAAQRRYSRTRFHLVDGNISIPLKMGSKSAEFIVDTDANISMMSESEARRLGLTILGVGENAIKMSGATGGQRAYRVAFAHKLTVGDVHLRHVAFLVLRDDQQPFVGLPSGKRGILGLPVLLAFETIGWSKKDELFEIAFPSETKDLYKANLCFDGSDPITDAEYRGRMLDFILDTGSENTDLWPAFAKEFAGELDKTGKSGSWKVTGVEGSKEFKSVTLPEIKLRVGGFEAILPSAHVLLEDTGANSQRYYGRLGMSTLTQAHTVRIDFKSMTLALK